MTIYIGKQYEIIMLIVIRRLYKDLSQLELSDNWFSIKEDLQFTYDLLGTIILFILIHLFYKMNKYRVRKLLKYTETRAEIIRFIQIKKKIALVLVPLFFLFGPFFIILGPLFIILGPLFITPMYHIHLTLARMRQWGVRGGVAPLGEALDGGCGGRSPPQWGFGGR